MVVDELDIINGSTADLCDDSTWGSLIKRIREGEYHAVLMSPPCSTFSRARRNDELESGPSALRGPEGRDLYGLAGLRPELLDKVKIGTLLGERAAEAAKSCSMHQPPVPWLLENPEIIPGDPSLFNLDNVKELLVHPGVFDQSFPQCNVGCLGLKHTRLRGTVHLGIATTCEHKKQEWIVPWSGKRFYSAHPPLRGKQLAIKACWWSPSMIRSIEPEGPYVTRTFAHYPSEFNRRLAERLCEAALIGVQAESLETSAVPLAEESASRKQDLGGMSSQHPGAHAPNYLSGPPGKRPGEGDAIEFSTPLRGRVSRTLKQMGNDEAIGGLRSAARSVAKLPKSREAGV